MTNINLRPDAETGTTTLGNVVEDAYSLNVKMEQAIIRVVNENGGFVRATPDCEPMFGYVYNHESERIEECKILALTTLIDNNSLSVLFGNDYDLYLLESTTNDEILESEEWYPALSLWSDVLANATLLNICEKLEEHIEYMLDVEDEDVEDEDIEDEDIDE